jgi:hypothetical protein
VTGATSSVRWNAVTRSSATPRITPPAEAGGERSSHGAVVASPGARGVLSQISP